MRRNWTLEEDKRLARLVKKYSKAGTRKWDFICDDMADDQDRRKGRSAQQCKERWDNYLNPTVNREQWTSGELKLVFDMHAELGNQWILISKKLHQRTSNDVKNQFYCAIRRGLRRLSRIGIRNREENKIRRPKEMKPITLSQILFSLQEKKKEVYQLLFQVSDLQNFKQLSKQQSSLELTEMINFITDKFLSQPGNSDHQAQDADSKGEEVRSLSQFGLPRLSQLSNQEKEEKQNHSREEKKSGSAGQEDDKMMGDCDSFSVLEEEKKQRRFHDLSNDFLEQELGMKAREAQTLKYFQKEFGIDLLQELISLDKEEQQPEEMEHLQEISPVPKTSHANNPALSSNFNVLEYFFFSDESQSVSSPQHQEFFSN